MSVAVESRDVASASARDRITSSAIDAASDIAAPASSNAPVIARLWRGRDLVIATLALMGILVHLALRSVFGVPSLSDAPLLLVLGVGGGVLVLELGWQAAHARFGSDQLAGVSIVASALLGEYLAGSIVVLMLSGGETLQRFAVGHATAALRALASRVPTIAHRRHENAFEDVPVHAVRVGDELSVLPHEICPVDGDVIQGHGAMDESYLTGEPFTIPKGPGSRVLSGALNAESGLIVRATRVAADSRYAQIMKVMQDAEQRRPTLRRIGDQIGAWFTPLALVIAFLAWWSTGDGVRFLSVVVVATPCPVLIAIPVAIIGAVSTAARRGIIVKDPAALEQLTLCRTMILDKTGTLTYGRPALTEERYAAPFNRETLLPIVAAVERYSRHPIASAIVDAATQARYRFPEVDWIREEPGVGLRGQVGNYRVLVTGRALASATFQLPPGASSGMECIVVVNDAYAATYTFLDVARPDSERFVGHLGPIHGFNRVLLVSGDREAEVNRLARSVSIDRVHAEQSPEQKVEIVRRESEVAKTVFISDGINDAPALQVALQSAVGGMALSTVGMILERGFSARSVKGSDTPAGFPGSKPASGARARSPGDRGPRSDCDRAADPMRRARPGVPAAGGR